VCLLRGADSILNTIHFKVCFSRVNIVPLPSACYHALFKPLTTPRFENLSTLSSRSIGFTSYAVSEDRSKINFRNILVFINCESEHVLNDTLNVTSPQKKIETPFIL
jgi:hypothetical protein